MIQMKDVTITVELTCDSDVDDVTLQMIVEDILRKQEGVTKRVEWYMTDVTSVVDGCHVPGGWRRLEERH